MEYRYGDRLLIRGINRTGELDNKINSDLKHNPKELKHIEDVNIQKSV